jgi:hypothetical protein
MYSILSLRKKPPHSGARVLLLTDEIEAAGVSGSTYLALIFIAKEFCSSRQHRKATRVSGQGVAVGLSQLRRDGAL